MGFPLEVMGLGWHQVAQELQAHHLRISLACDLLILDCLITCKDPRSGRGSERWLPDVAGLPTGRPLYYRNSGGVVQ